MNITVSGTPEEIIEFARVLKIGASVASARSDLLKPLPPNVFDELKAARESEADEEVADLVDPEVLALVCTNMFIEAIRLYRSKSGCSLKEAKDYIDLLKYGDDGDD